MDDLLRFLSDHRHALKVVWGGGVVALVVASVVIRLCKREGLFMKPQGSVLFHERFGSGNSHRSLLTRLGGAQNCLLVTVTDRELLIRPWPPFNLFFLPEIYDLEHRIPLAEIVELRERTNWMGLALLDLEYRRADGGTRRITLFLRGKSDFLQALQKSGIKPQGAK